MVLLDDQEYTDKEVAYFTGVTVRLLKRWREKGRENEGPEFVHHGRKVRYVGAKIRRWMKHKKIAAG